MQIDLSIDPRVKIFHTLIIGIMIFILKTDQAFALYIAHLLLTLVFFKQIKEAFKFTAAFIILVFIYFMGFWEFKNPVISTLSYFAFFVIKFLPIPIAAVIMTKTITSAELIGAFQKLRIHRNITIPFAVAMRFIPSLRKELGFIRDAMKMRGINYGLGGFIKSPLRLLEYITVPLLMRCVKITDELSVSAIVRGIENPKPRTMMRELKAKPQDFIYFSSIIILNSIILFIDRVI